MSTVECLVCGHVGAPKTSRAITIKMIGLFLYSTPHVRQCVSVDLIGFLQDLQILVAIPSPSTPATNRSNFAIFNYNSEILAAIDIA